VYPAYWEPWYWNPWYWGSAISIGYSYYPHSWGYWNSYPGYHHWGYGGSYNYYHAYAARNSGYHRNGTSRGTAGVNQSGRYGSASTGSMRGAASSSRDQGSSIHFGKSRNSNTGYNGRSTYRQSNGSRYNPSVQQPRHRDQGVTPGRTSREGSSHGRENYRNQGSSQRNSAPSYSPPPQSRTNSAPSAPAPRNDGGGGRQSSGSGRSHR
jgi:hypothetical protein